MDIANTIFMILLFKFHLHFVIFRGDRHFLPLNINNSGCKEVLQWANAVQEPFHSLGMILCDCMLIHCFVALQEQPHIISSVLG